MNIAETIYPPGQSFPNEEADGVKVTPNDGDGRMADLHKRKLLGM